MYCLPHHCKQFKNNAPAGGMQYGPAAAEFPYSAMIASFVLVWAAAGVGAEPNISEPAGTADCAGAAGTAERKSAKGSTSAWRGGGDMSVKRPQYTQQCLD